MKRLKPHLPALGTFLVLAITSAVGLTIHALDHAFVERVDASLDPTVRRWDEIHDPTHWLLVVLYGGNFGCLLCLFGHLRRQIRSQEASATELRQARNLLATVIESAPVAIILVDWDGKIQIWNSGAETMFGWKADGVAGRLLSLVPPDQRADWQQLVAMTCLGQSVHQRELRCQRRDGSVFAAEWSAVPVYDSLGQGVGMVGMMTDISDRKRAEQQLLRSARQDQLTGLPNRVALQERLEHAIVRYQRRPQQLFAVLFVDLDRFKAINDTYGHAVGDRFLQRMAQRISQSLRSEDMVARLGGDEFVVVLEFVQDEQHALSCAHRIQAAIAQPLDIADSLLCPSASIGLALVHPHYQRADAMLRDADHAMYAAKAAGRGCCRVSSATPNLSTNPP